MKRLTLLIWLFTTVSAHAQNMPREIGVYVAFGGQAALNSGDNGNPGFFSDPTILRLSYGFLSNGVQSLAVTLENVSETRSRTGTWSEIFLGGAENNFPARISENLHMTTLGLETVRNLLSESGWRLGVGIGVAYGLGRANADVVDLKNNTPSSAKSADVWQGLLITGVVRLRYSIYTTGSYDIGLIAAGRYWGFPYIGPLGESFGSYDGPSIRTLSQLGYLAGISVGF